MLTRHFMSAITDEREIQSIIVYGNIRLRNISVVFITSESRKSGQSNELKALVKVRKYKMDANF